MKLHHVEETTAQVFEAETDKESSGEESEGGGTELDYGDSEEVVVLPDADNAANQTADVDVVKISDGPSAV